MSNPETVTLESLFHPEDWAELMADDAPMRFYQETRAVYNQLMYTQGRDINCHQEALVAVHLKYGEQAMQVVKATIEKDFDL